MSKISEILNHVTPGELRKLRPLAHKFRAVQAIRGIVPSSLFIAGLHDATVIHEKQNPKEGHHFWKAPVKAADNLAAQLVVAIRIADAKR